MYRTDVTIGWAALLPAAVILSVAYAWVPPPPPDPYTYGEGPQATALQLLLVTTSFGLLYSTALGWLAWRGHGSASLLIRAWPIPLFVAYALASAAWSAFPTRVAVNAVHLAGFVLLALVTARTCGDLRRFAFVTAAGAGVALAASLVAALALPGVGLDPYDATGRWRGITSNPNTLGALGVLAVWAAGTAWRLAPGASGRFVLGAVLLLAAACIVGSGSRTALVLSLAVAAFLFTAQHAASLGAMLARALLVALALLLVLAMAYALDADSVALDRLLGRLGRTADLTGRTDLWAFALRAIGERPWLGWGFDHHATLAATTGASVAQFHNGYLDLLVRGGALGLVAALLVIAGVVAGTFRRARTDALGAFAVLVFVGAVLLHNVTEASLGQSRNLFWWTVLTLYLLQAGRPPTTEGAPDSRLAGPAKAVPAADRFPHLLR